MIPSLNKSLRLLTGLALLLACSWIAEADYLRWNKATRQVDADVSSWNFDQLMTQMARAADWDIYCEPGATNSISIRFKAVRQEEALERLLRTLNYALLPQAGARTRLFIYKTSIHEATKLVKRDGETKARNSTNGIQNELVVVLKKGGGKDLDQLAAKLGARVVGRIEGSNAYRLAFDDPEATQLARDALSSDPNVASVENNYTISRPTNSDQLQASSPLNLNLKPGDAGGKIVVGLVDAQVQTKGTKLADFLLPGVSVVGDGTAPADSPTHGTSMAETILRGLATANLQGNNSTAVRILPVDIYGQSESTSTFDVAQGIVAAIKNGATIINLSLGTPSDSPFLHQLIQAYSAKGVLFVAAAGNEPTTVANYPAAYSEVLAVTAGDKNGNLANYASRGSFVGAVAPGTGLVAYDSHTYMVTGTSVSTAYVSGLAAGLSSQTGKSPTEVAAQIRKALAPSGRP